MKKAPRDLARGERIKHVRLELLQMRSQEEFATWLGDVTRGAVGNWERGMDISLTNLTRISQRAGIPLEWLAFGKGDTPAVARPTNSAPDSGSAEAKLLAATAVYEDLPRELQKEFLRRALDLEERGRS